MKKQLVFHDKNSAHNGNQKQKNSLIDDAVAVDLFVKILPFSVSDSVILQTQVGDTDARFCYQTPQILISDFINFREN